VSKTEQFSSFGDFFENVYLPDSVFLIKTKKCAALKKTIMKKDVESKVAAMKWV